MLEDREEVMDVAIAILKGRLVNEFGKENLPQLGIKTPFSELGVSPHDLLQDMEDELGGADLGFEKENSLRTGRPQTIEELSDLVSRSLKIPN